MAQAQTNPGSTADRYEGGSSKSPWLTCFRVACWFILFLVVVGPFLYKFVMLLLLSQVHRC